MELSNKFINVLYKETFRLSHKVKHNSGLTPEERLDAVANTLVIVKKKMEIEHVPSDDYENYKGYLFIVLSNFIKRELNNRKEHTKQIHYNHNYNTSTIGQYDNYVESIELSDDLSEKPMMEEYIIPGLVDDETPGLDGEVQSISALQTYISELPPLFKYVLELKMDGHTFEGIAKRIGMSASNVKQIIDKSRKLIRIRMGETISGFDADMVIKHANKTGLGKDLSDFSQPEIIFVVDKNGKKRVVRLS